MKSSRSATSKSRLTRSGLPRSELTIGRRLAGALLVAAVATVALPSFAAETVKIYRSTMPDGSVVLGDKPSTGARSVATDTIVLSAPRGSAEAERDYWRREAEAFNLRQQRREAEDAPSRWRAPARPDDLAMYDEWRPLATEYGYDAGKPLVPLRAVPRTYTSSPGAVNGRSSGFIGSGFSTSGYGAQTVPHSNRGHPPRVSPHANRGYQR
jgi:hypothetical protein